MMFKIALISVLFVLCNLNRADGAVCTFTTVGPEYICTLNNANIQDDASQQVPPGPNGGGVHIGGLGDQDVVAVVATATSASAIGVFPTLVMARFPNLRRVVFTNVAMRQFTSGIQNCGNLTSITVSNNEITNVPAQIFLSCNQLTTLDLSNNRIDGINVAAFLGTNLVNLWLSNNRLVLLSQNMLGLTPNLQVLRADNNAIMRVTENNFISVPHLTHLYLHNNRLTDWEQRALPNQPELTVLRLDNNHIGNISANAFTRLPALTTLNLRTNHITSIEENAFINLPAVSELDLAHNRLVHLKAQAIRPIAQMRILDVSNNSITSIERELFDGVSALQFRSTQNQCFNQAITIANAADFNNRVANLLGNCFSFATSVKTNISILIVSVLLSFIWKM